jgi:hypothetical protein
VVARTTSYSSWVVCKKYDDFYTSNNTEIIANTIFERIQDNFTLMKKWMLSSAERSTNCQETTENNYPSIDLQSASMSYQWKYLFRHFTIFEKILYLYYVGQGFYNVRLTWCPDLKDNELHHNILLTCKNCSKVKKACQAYGHYNLELNSKCDREPLQTTYDQPLCPDCSKRSKCSESCVDFYSDDFSIDTFTTYMIPTHNRLQKFINSEGDHVLVIFKDSDEVDRFLLPFTAKACLENKTIAIDFQSTKMCHMYRIDSGNPILLDITIEKRRVGLNDFQILFVSGNLEPKFSG